ncbi:helix-turn-helix domain-containing protein [Aurantiacibacter zhengii]|uniref:DUF4019 domain-containing protein n=1 Tax=Aurantiacibacter zhengii TaxID=2307003 RepID=A0A418NNL5_9SPHN|nr:DUF4019 domain-containing protein [Aurantiacibacter zhengii]RIV83396.1 DUF4019 domain-containing protein [Aurantiacibacter zhengii]
MTRRATDAIEDLTAKEKEALRLLLAGHDAKSSARELGLSVHTVNDRLRNARRKMEVSSSREAARILGDAEGAPPQPHAHNEMGMANESALPDPADLDETRQRGPSKAVWLAGGMLTMSVLIAIAAVTLMTGDAPANTEAATANAFEESEDAMPASRDAESMAEAEAFLAEVDAGDWEGSWEVAGAYFQSEASVAEWAAIIDPVRTPLGAVDARSIATVQRASTLPGAPEGEYEVLQFNTQFAGRAEPAIETLIMLQGADGWQVTGYFIR